MANVTKDWDQHVAQTRELASSEGFQSLRDQIIELGAPEPHEAVLDIGAGTGLLALAIAPAVTQVWALDISISMCLHLKRTVAEESLQNIEVLHGSAERLPLLDASVDLVVSNYCLHHLDDPGKRRALAEAHRVLRPGGRIVIGDMMFSLSLVDARDRQLLANKVRTLAGRGPAGLMRLAKNAGRVLRRRWEKPVRADWWQQALVHAGFQHVEVCLLDHEGGIATARRAPTLHSNAEPTVAGRALDPLRS